MGVTVIDFIVGEAYNGCMIESILFGIVMYVLIMAVVRAILSYFD